MKLQNGTRTVKNIWKRKIVGCNVDGENSDVILINYYREKAFIKLF